MFEETNQTAEILETMEEDFTQGFEEEALAGEEEFAEEVLEEEQEEAGEREEREEVEEPEEEPAYTIKYNGQEMELPVSQLVTLAQKGMNYDHVYGELSRIKSSPELAVLERFAQQSGMSREEYVRYLESEFENQQIQSQVQQGMSEPAARRMLALEAKERQRQALEQQERAKEEKTAQYLALANAYPGLKELPAQVVQAIRNGEPPLAAYRAYENAQLRQELEAVKTNTRNQSKAMGSMSDSAATPPVSDFLSGWESE